MGIQRITREQNTTSNTLNNVKVKHNRNGETKRCYWY